MAKYTGTSNWTFRLGVSPAPSHLAKLFGQASVDFNDYRAAFGRIAPKALQNVKRIMDGKGSPLGMAWPGLKDKYYLARKSKKGWSRAEMYASYRLAQSIGIVSITKRALKFGTGVKYAKALQWGRIGKNQPRMFIGLDDTFQRQAIEELNADVNAKLASLASRINSSNEEIKR
jgi:phage gpG-like protein